MTTVLFVPDLQEDITEYYPSKVGKVCNVITSRVLYARKQFHQDDNTDEIFRFQREQEVKVNEIIRKQVAKCEQQSEYGA